jgi:hypothetical protein
MLYVGLCKDNCPGGCALYVVDDIDCMPAGLLSFPDMGRSPTPDEKDTEAPIRAAREYVEEWDLVDHQTPPLHIIVNTSTMYWEGLAVANDGGIKLQDDYKDE